MAAMTRTAHYLLYQPARTGSLAANCSCGYALGDVGPRPEDPMGMLRAERVAVRLLAAHHRDVDLGSGCGYTGCRQAVADESELGLCPEHDAAARDVLRVKA